MKFEIHPSNDYILILSSVGYIFLFKLQTGELRGKIKVLRNSLNFVIDPSGLYIALVAAPPSNFEVEI